MLLVLQALAPVFLMVILGYGCKLYKFPHETFWPSADRLNYFVLFPSLLIEKIAKAELGRPELLPMNLLMIALISLIVLVLALIYPLVRTSPAAFTSIFQGSIRPNTYVGLAGALSLYGEEGLALIALVMAGVIPLVNVWSVLAFVLLIPGSKQGFRGALFKLIQNPLIIACLLGILLNTSGIGLSGTMDEIFQTLGRAALPIGLLSVGAGLRIASLSQSYALIGLASFLKLLALPLLTYLVSKHFQIDTLVSSVMVLYASLPCSVSSYTLAAQLGGDKELVAGIITLQTLLAMLSIPTLLIWIQS